MIVPTKPGQEKIGPIVGVCGFIALATAMYFVFRHQKYRVEVYSGGMKVKSPTSVVFETTWDDVSHLEEQREGTTEADFCGFTVVKKDGARIRCYQHYEPFDDLKQRVTTEVYRLARERVNAVFEQNGAVEFGELKVGRQGVECRGRRVPWNAVVVSYGSVDMVVSDGPTRQKIWNMPVGLIPNFSVMLEIFASAGIDT